MVGVLSPIAERSEDSPSFGGVRLLVGTQSLSLMSSYEPDGIRQGSKTAGLNSLGGQNDNLTVYPDQRILHQFRTVSSRNNP